MKKIIGIFISVFLLLSVSVTADTVFASSLSDSIVVQLTETHTDSQIDINVRLVTNPGISDMVLELDYNKNIFEFVGYDRGPVLNDNYDLDVTPLSNERTLPIRFYWYNQNVSNVFSTGNILKLHFALKVDCPSGEYNIGFKYNDGDITYIENNISKSKSAIISKAVVRVTENKISETEIIETSVNNNKTNLFLILGVATVTIAVIVVAAAVIIKNVKRKRKKNWLKI